MQPETQFTPTGIHAVLGMDIVDFSTLDDHRGLAVIGKFMIFVRQALSFHGLGSDAYRWSPAGDGGYITFRTDTACRKALDVAFSIFERVQSTNGEFEIRAGLHAGIVTERQDIGRASNIWGMGINMAARILSVSGPGQLLISQQYHDLYLKDLGKPTTISANGAKPRYQVGESYRRTVKHGATVQVMNVSRPGICLSCEAASLTRWNTIGRLWADTIAQYRFLISDAMHSGQPMAAVAAAQCLLALGEEDAPRLLCNMLSNRESDPDCDYPARRHPILSAMPGSVLLDVVRRMKARPTRAGEKICVAGDQANTCFFPVSGKLDIHIPGRERKRELSSGEIFGEFGLWVPKVARTATVTALDDGLILEIEDHHFRDILETHDEAREIVHSIIRSRIVEDVWSSSDLFPGLAMDRNGNVSDLNAECLQIRQSASLELAQHTYVLVTGAVSIKGFGDARLEVRGGGRFDKLAVVGIESPIGDPDAGRADVTEDGIAVLIPRETLRCLQEQHPKIRKAWLGLAAERLSQMGFSVAPEAATAQSG